MDSEKWRKIKGILEAAMELPAAVRPEYLAKVCGGNDDLRREVESLLQFDNTKADVLENSAFEAAFGENSAAVGRQIDKYRIIGTLGAGGMGAVYLAERSDGSFEQKVALKLIKRGMDSDAVLRRFVNERQILASLEHPNIAHLIDGGTTNDHSPFFVMEYVEGATITDFAHRENLDYEARLNLFRQICAAVSFAHSNLVVHRDLKPSNILVTKDGVPKLLDFGIAKLLKTENGSETATQNFVFTPEYASPEQVRGEKLTTATDVYSLGVILYELLTGNRPYRTGGANISEIIKSVCEVEPQRPSSVVRRHGALSGIEQSKELPTTDGRPTDELKFNLQNSKSLKGDLDTIILKALNKEPARRYSSVEQFSEDLRRHQNGLPVFARPATFKYRAEKFLERSRAAVAAGVLIFLALVGGLAATIYQANIARHERAKAERRFQDVRALANSFMFEINEKIVESPIKARELLVTRAVEYLDKLALEAGGDADLQSELATGYEKIGDVQSDFFDANLGKTSDALKSQRKALKIRENLFAAEPRNPQFKLDVAQSRNRVADALAATGEQIEAVENYRRSIALFDQLHHAEPGDVAVRRGLSNTYGKLGQAIMRCGSLSESLKNYEKALAIQQSLAAENPQDARIQHGLSVYYSYQGYVKLEMGALTYALADFRRALEIEERIFAGDPRNVKYKSDLTIANIWVGVALRELGATVESLAHLQKALAFQQTIFDADPANIGAQNGLADCFLELGMALAKTGKSGAAIETFQRAVENYESVANADARNLAARRQVYFTRRYSAAVYARQNETEKALEILEKAREAFKELTAQSPDNNEWQHDFALCYLQIGEIALRKKDRKKAAANFAAALPILERLTVQTSEHAKRRQDLETVKNYIAANQE